MRTFVTIPKGFYFITPSGEIFKKLNNDAGGNSETLDGKFYTALLWKKYYFSDNIDELKGMWL